ncbi:hypothetical protein A2W45_02925 [Candidatus Curtissbacteria bacterium RIFCSPHIGHO2_12_41_11]|uniref:Uncharacterized protein n=3 Tax=Candidatus Curtissiibacteriota TaxID=1752717 RepID=A0A1F5HU61_9BACT|nr:MAG: hypothetical protein UU56_C0026G0009 [Candidatus Curtissbacteria bacterium GW2011_GWA2_41_24]OGD88633.1 MAG: hypothetical protein A2Z54_02585 [Candidatus Curtissbacteria bacterium RIFCSPHIGHO2_02_39_8]OGD99707.1 MAG: hypothetical protein A2W45_02925 [Candidatus Curtissbacteria bacterium RIFCSPHIGHO2_12_41_11]OGE07616.1 MAG: hypothetical protein A2W70_02400 [Candidatus Curtissbacteria bacterium RIFCSPLOWO2_02_41_11]
MNEVGTEVIEKTTAQPSDQSTAKQPEVEKVAAQVQHTTREENPKNALTQLANRNKVKPEISDSIESEEARRAREVLGKIVQGVKDWKPFEEEHDIKLDDDLEHLVEEGDMYSLLRLKSENYREIEMHTTYSYRDRSYRSSKTTEIGKKTELAERDSEIKSDLRNSLQRRVRIKAAILRVVKMKNSDYREDDIYTYIDEKNEKRQNMWFGDISRQELLESAIDLALSVDANIPNSLELCKIAESLGIGESILKFLVGSREDFFLKLVTKVLDEPFKELPNYIKGFMARNINSAKLIDLASALSEEKVSTQQLFKSLTENLSNGELPGIFPERLKEFLILGENPNIARYVRSGVFEMEGLLKRIVSRKDFMGYAKTFDLIIGRGDDAKLCFEYARLSDSLSRGRFTWDEFPEIQGEIPGLPDHLQWRNMSIASRRRFLSDGGTKTDDQIREMDKIEPKNFSEKGRLILIRAILTEVISKSKNSRVKQNADKRNRELVGMDGEVLKTGDLLHGTDIGHFTAILSSGDRSGEFLGFVSINDATPLGADYSQVLQTDVDGSFTYDDEKAETRLSIQELRNRYKENPFGAIYGASIAAQYGARPRESFTSHDAKSSEDTGISLIFNRQRNDVFLRGMEYSGQMRSHHILIPVGLPSTEITGVIVNENATETLDKAKQNIVDNGFFIPIYGLDGKLLFTLIHYDQMRNSQAELTSAV